MSDSEPVDPHDLILEDPWDYERKSSEYFLERNRRKTEYSHNPTGGKDPRYGRAHIQPWVFGSEQGSCDRFLGFMAIGQPEIVKTEEKLRRVFDMGNAIHDMIRERLKRMYGESNLQSEVSFFIPHLSISGRVDNVYHNVHGMEVKSCGKADYVAVSRSRRPLPKHILQAMCYFVGLKLESLTFLYINKEGYNPEKAFTIGFNPVRFRQLEERIITRVLEPIERGEAPLPHRGSYCTTCSFLEVCRAEKFGY